MPVYGSCPDQRVEDSHITISSSTSGSNKLDESVSSPPRDETRQRLIRRVDSHFTSIMTLAEVLYAYDLTGAQLLHQRFGQSKLARALWEVLSHTGDGILWFLMVLPVVGIMWLAGYLDNASPAAKTVFVSFYTCNFVDIIAIILMKLAFKRQRPPHHRADGRFVGPDQHSFPSGHATRVWCIVALFLDMSSRQPEVIRSFFSISPTAMRVLIVLWALAISFSRIALGRHYPSDVLAGSLIGAFLLYPIASLIIQQTSGVKQA